MMPGKGREARILRRRKRRLRWDWAQIGVEPDEAKFFSFILFSIFTDPFFFSVFFLFPLFLFLFEFRFFFLTILFSLFSLDFLKFEN